jgi:CRP/FNR family transcriptional regulator, anaerobic regulatory protein
MTDAVPQWLAHFPMLAELHDAAWQQAMRTVQVIALPLEAAAFRPGDPCKGYLMVIEGSIRVQMLTESGKEIVLYRVTPGETCVLTTACLFGGSAYAAEGIAETEVRAVFLPLGEFERVVAQSAGFRRFVFSSFGNRLADLVVLVEEVAFGRMDRRLAQRLVALADPSGHVTLTHHQLAVELGTAREVVSRLLKEFERHRWVALRRGHIALLDRSALTRQANEGKE